MQVGTFLCLAYKQVPSNLLESQSGQVYLLVKKQPIMSWVGSVDAHNMRSRRNKHIMQGTQVCATEKIRPYKKV